MKARILVVDDEETIRKLLKSRLEREGHEVITACNTEEAQAAFGAGAEVDVLVTDLKMPGKDGFTLMSWAKQAKPDICIVVITGHGEKDAAIKALRLGACDYLEKPFDMDELSHTVARGIREGQLRRDNHDLISRLEARVERIEGAAEDQFWYVSKATAMNKVNDWLTVLRREGMRGTAEEPTVLITGESGTGKEGIARMIHAASRRGKGPWVAVNCANFNEQLLESELFGHERGAFTGATTLKRGLFEIAKGGTLFLDEIGEMDIKVQAKLLRVLQERVFRRVGSNFDLHADVRVVAATNWDLELRSREGFFREDLFHRLSRVVIQVPPLRERSEDIVPMAAQFCERAFRARGKAFKGFSPDGESSLCSYGWPGNVRELLNVIERVALVWTGDGFVTARALSLPSASLPIGPANGPRLELVKPNPLLEIGVESYTALKKRWSESFEREFLTATLNKHGGNVSAAAREAKLDRSNFLRLLRRYGLRADVFRKAA